MKKNIKLGYESWTEKDLWLPPNYKFRLFKFNLGNRWKNLKIYNKQYLLKLLKRYNPIAVYYTAGCFLNPLKIEHPNYQADKYLMFRDFIFDFDDVYISEVYNLLNEMQSEKSFNLNKILNSSKNSYQVSYSLKDKPNVESIKDKYKWYEKILKGITTEMIYRGIKIDKCPTTNLIGVYRLNQTKHKSGVISKFINTQEIILEGERELENPFKTVSMNQQDLTSLDELHLNDVGGDKPNLARGFSSIKYYKGVYNKVSKKKLYYLYLKYDSKKKGLKFVLRDIKRLDKLYKVGGMLVRNNGEFIDVLSKRYFDFKRLSKIYKNSRATNRNILLKFKRVFIPLTEINGNKFDMQEYKSIYNKEYSNKLFNNDIINMEIMKR